jgi:hypothetical protein
MEAIYYVFEKTTGLYMGSGTPYFDDDVYGCTEVPTPNYNNFTETCKWTGTEWIVIPK